MWQLVVNIWICSTFANNSLIQSILFLIFCSIRLRESTAQGVQKMCELHSPTIILVALQFFAIVHYNLSNIMGSYFLNGCDENIRNKLAILHLLTIHGSQKHCPLRGHCFDIDQEPIFSITCKNPAGSNSPEILLLSRFWIFKVFEQF